MGWWSRLISAEITGREITDGGLFLAPSFSTESSMAFNLYYIRAAIQQRTGRVLTFNHIRRLLVEEGLVSNQELNSNPLAKEFEGYGRFFAYEDNSVGVPFQPSRFLPDMYLEELLDEEDG
jgi:hypothetical protein|tara:strand:+ start:1308 stop:1670 length:363 start_codon:yes stop_codon:yes gene_type:complete